MGAEGRAYLSGSVLLTDDSPGAKGKSYEFRYDPVQRQCETQYANGCWFIGLLPMALLLIDRQVVVLHGETQD